MDVFCVGCSALVSVTRRGPVTCEACALEQKPSVRFVDWFQHSTERWSRVLDRPELIIGRGMVCNIILNTARVARLHCQVTETDAGRLVTDLDTSTGTIVEFQGVEQRLGEWPLLLQHGSVVVIAANRLDFRSVAVPHVTVKSGFDEHAADASAWHVWADELLERADPLGLWLAGRHPAFERHALAGALLLPADSNVSARWNEFGFLSHLSLPERHLSFWFEHHLEPAVALLLTLDVVTTPDECEATLEYLRTMQLPRSLRRLTIDAAPPSALAALRHELSERCPWLEC